MSAPPLPASESLGRSYSGLARIRVGRWRDDASGPMQVVSGPIGRQRVHFEGPPADRLERAQKQSLDVTEWLAWFLDTLHRSVDQAQHMLDTVLARTRFWHRWAATPLNERQVKLINRLLDGFEGKLSSSKWAAMAKCSPDTALRDITELLALGILRKSEAGGRSTSYELNT